MVRNRGAKWPLRKCEPSPRISRLPSPRRQSEAWNHCSLNDSVDLRPKWFYPSLASLALGRKRFPVHFLRLIWPIVLITASDLQWNVHPFMHTTAFLTKLLIDSNAEPNQTMFLKKYIFFFCSFWSLQQQLSFYSLLCDCTTIHSWRLLSSQPTAHVHFSTVPEWEL